MSNCVLKQIKPETSLEAKMTKLKLFYFWNIMRRQGALEKNNIAGKTRRQQKKSERPNMG